MLRNYTVYIYILYIRVILFFLLNIYERFECNGPVFEPTCGVALEPIADINPSRLKSSFQTSLSVSGYRSIFNVHALTDCGTNFQI